MKSKIVQSMQKAYEIYNLNTTEDLEEKLLKYILDRITTNKEEIEKVIEINKSNLEFDKILETVKNEIDSKVISYGKTIINKDGFMFSQVLVPIGVIAVEAYDALEIIKYWIKAIKTRNAVAISSVDYDETSIEALILIIIKEAISKYELDGNLIEYIPFEECNYAEFDRTIYTYDKEGKTLEQFKLIEKEVEKDQVNKSYVYLEDDYFKNEVENNKGAEILTGDFGDVLQKIKNAKCASIYTQDSKIAFDFINLADCKNVFVNANVMNAVENLKTDEIFYKYKNIIIPLPKEVLVLNEEESEKSIDLKEQKNETEEQPSKEKATNLDNNEIETQMIKYKESLWEKIKRRFKEFFKLK